MDTFFDRVKLILLTVALCSTSNMALANNSDNDKSSRRSEKETIERHLGDSGPKKKSLLQVFELENSRFGNRNNVVRDEMSARLKISEAIASEAISTRTPKTPESIPQSIDRRIESTPSERTLFHDGAVERRYRKQSTSRLIKDKLLKPYRNPFKQPEPPLRKREIQTGPDAVYKPIRRESVREARLPSSDNNQQSRAYDAPIADKPDQKGENKRRYESKFDADSILDQKTIAPSPAADLEPAFDNPMPDSYNDDLPMTDTQRLDNLENFQQKSYSTLERLRQPQTWQPIRNNGTPSSSVSAVMSPLIRHTPAGIEVNFSDSFATLPQESETQDIPARQDKTQDIPDWDSILGGDSEPGGDNGALSQDAVPDSADESLDLDAELDESEFEMDLETEESSATDDAVRKAREIQSIEKQRDGYRQALNQPLTQSPAQMTLQYLDDDGREVPASEQQRFYLLQFNNYRFSPYYNNQCRVDAQGMSWCPSDAVWKTPDLCYHPLYFEEVNLERFGGRFPYGQPFISAAHFFGSVVTLPYAMGVKPPHCCYYSAGYGRPGNKYSYQLKRPVWSLRGATLQSLLVTGLVFGLP